MDCMNDVKNGAGVITYVDVKTKGRKMITKIYTDWCADFAPQYRLKKIRKKVEEEGKSLQSELGYPQIQIDEVFQLGKHLAALNNSLDNPLKRLFFTAKDARDDVIQKYITENGLDAGDEVRGGHIKLDPLICRMCGNLKPEQRQVRKDVIFKSL